MTETDSKKRIKNPFDINDIVMTTTSNALNIPIKISDVTANNTNNKNEQRKQRLLRTTYTNEQLDRLEQMFHVIKYPDVTTREEMAVMLQLTESRIQVN